MATTTLERDVESKTPESKKQESKEEQNKGHGRKWSPTMIAVTVMSASLLMVFVLTFLLVNLTPASTMAGFGLAVYCTFWLGGGFGLIFTGASVFGGDH